MIKARDIRIIIQQKGMEVGVIHILEGITEQQLAQKAEILALAKMFAEMINTMQNVVGVAGHMKDAVDKLRGAAEDEDGLGESTQSIGREN